MSWSRTYFCFDRERKCWDNNEPTSVCLASILCGFGRSSFVCLKPSVSHCNDVFKLIDLRCPNPHTIKFKIYIIILCSWQYLVHEINLILLSLLSSFLCSISTQRKKIKGLENVAVLWIILYIKLKYSSGGSGEHFLASWVEILSTLTCRPSDRTMETLEHIKISRLHRTTINLNGLNLSESGPYWYRYIETRADRYTNTAWH